MKTILLYKGTSLNINDTVSNYFMSQLINQYDIVILKGPFSNGSTGLVYDSNDADFFNNIKISNKSVWFALQISPSGYILSASDAVASALNQMQVIWSLLVTYNLQNKLAGFFVDTISLGNSAYTNGSRFTREQLNSIVSAAHATYLRPVGFTSYQIPDLISTVGNTRARMKTPPLSPPQQQSEQKF
jgi:hypothetical protein